MANDFSGDSNCKAVWNLDSGALTTDSKGSNTLTDNNTVGTDGADYKQGDQSADFVNANDEYLSITDANLDAGFPLKNGDSNKKISLCFWMKHDDLVSYYIMGKWNAAGAKRSILVSKGWGDDLWLYIGYNGGASNESVAHASIFAANIWYHVGITLDDSDKSYRIRVWDDNASAILGSDKTGNFTNNINIEDAAWTIGRREDSGYSLDGHLDEICIFNDILTTDEIDQIRAGTYGAAGGLSIPGFFGSTLHPVLPLLKGSNL